MILLLLCSLAFGEPQFTQLTKGEPAPFSGRLFNDDAVANLIVDKQSIEDACAIEVDFELEKAHAKWNYDFQIMQISLEGKLERANALIESQSQEIDYLRSEHKPARTFLWVSTGFAVGTLTSLGIYHSVKD